MRYIIIITNDDYAASRRHFFVNSIWVITIPSNFFILVIISLLLLLLFCALIRVVFNKKLVNAILGMKISYQFLSTDYEKCFFVQFMKPIISFCSRSVKSWPYHQLLLPSLPPPLRPPLILRDLLLKRGNFIS